MKSVHNLKRFSPLTGNQEVPGMLRFLQIKLSVDGKDVGSVNNFDNIAISTVDASG